MSLDVFHLHNETNASCPDFSGQKYQASFHTRSSAKGPRKKIYRAHLEGQGPRKGEHAVVKVFRSASGTEAMCDNEIAKHVMARKLAKKFNKMVPDENDKIQFTLPLKSTVEKFGVGEYLFRHSRHLDKQEWVLIEENMVRHTDLKFEVFLRKTGDRVGKDPSSLDAFVHFTYLESKQNFVMCGFQGIHTEEEGYKMSTPCIHSQLKQFGPTDKGPSGIRAVFRKHRCNNICYTWPKPTDRLTIDQAQGGGGGCDPEDGDNEADADRVDSSLAFEVGAHENLAADSHSNSTTPSPEESPERELNTVVFGVHARRNKSLSASGRNNNENGADAVTNGVDNDYSNDDLAPLNSNFKHNPRDHGDLSSVSSTEELETLQFDQKLGLDNPVICVEHAD